jgi:hypothetical protein
MFTRTSEYKHLKSVDWNANATSNLFVDLFDQALDPRNRIDLLHLAKSKIIRIDEPEIWLQTFAGRLFEQPSPVAITGLDVILKLHQYHKYRPAVDELLRSRFDRNSNVRIHALRSLSFIVNSKGKVVNNLLQKSEEFDDEVAREWRRTLALLISQRQNTKLKMVDDMISNDAKQNAIVRIKSGLFSKRLLSQSYAISDLELAGIDDLETYKQMIVIATKHENEDMRRYAYGFLFNSKLLQSLSRQYLTRMALLDEDLMINRLARLHTAQGN